MIVEFVAVHSTECDDVDLGVIVDNRVFILYKGEALECKENTFLVRRLVKPCKDYHHHLDQELVSLSDFLSELKKREEEEKLQRIKDSVGKKVYFASNPRINHIVIGMSVLYPNSLIIESLEDGYVQTAKFDHLVVIKE